MLFTSGWFASPTTITAYPSRLKDRACSCALFTKGQGGAVNAHPPPPPAPPRAQLRVVCPRDAVGADDDLPARDLIHRLDDVHPPLLELLHRLGIVDEGPQRVDRGPRGGSAFPPFGGFVGEGDRRK